MANREDKAAPGEPKDDARPLHGQAPAAAVKKTPVEWAKTLGHWTPKGELPQQLEAWAPQYAAANELFGWDRHAYDYQAPKDRFEITEDVYLKALECAGHHPAGELFRAALPHSQEKRFTNFKARGFAGQEKV